MGWGLVVRREVVLNLVDGTAVRGVLFRKAGGLLEVVNATLLQPGVEPAPLDGSVFVERARVLFIQAP